MRDSMLSVSLLSDDNRKRLLSGSRDVRSGKDCLRSEGEGSLLVGLGQRVRQAAVHRLMAYLRINCNISRKHCWNRSFCSRFVLSSFLISSASNDSDLFRFPVLGRFVVDSEREETGIPFGVAITEAAGAACWSLSICEPQHGDTKGAISQVFNHDK